MGEKSTDYQPRGVLFLHAVCDKLQGTYLTLKKKRKFLGPPQPGDDTSSYSSTALSDPAEQSSAQWDDIYSPWGSKGRGDPASFQTTVYSSTAHPLCYYYYFIVIIVIVALCLLRHSLLWEDRTTHLLEG